MRFSVRVRVICCIPQAIAELMQKLKEHLKELRKVMRNPSLEYTAVNNVQVGLRNSKSISLCII